MSFIQVLMLILLSFAKSFMFFSSFASRLQFLVVFILFCRFEFCLLTRRCRFLLSQVLIVLHLSPIYFLTQVASFCCRFYFVIESCSLTLLSSHLLISVSFSYFLLPFYMFLSLFASESSSSSARFFFWAFGVVQNLLSFIYY